MGGGHPEVPDWRIYRVADAPQLLETQEKLAKHGLKDPWLRNEVWRYTIKGVKNETTLGIMRKSVFRGFPIAVGVAAAMILTQKAYTKMNPSADHGHH